MQAARAKKPSPSNNFAPNKVWGLSCRFQIIFNGSRIMKKSVMQYMTDKPNPTANSLIHLVPFALMKAFQFEANGRHPKKSVDIEQIAIESCTTTRNLAIYLVFRKK